ncbi:hypothetical protein IE077_002474 [Cardiosporidium cionae]|uniref:Transmembrane protein n=1 Tax=Cardiosporidium cionae TaxID=476202 RepID=A0ABQ7JAU7_9APIC|nr:hypothetical protein IE077_002474 [Cardiosporidium cionae]|eukprot:KAF8821089.1 hypothetical protein IE077_002474 [Cardiosporidium cionae]
MLLVKSLINICILKFFSKAYSPMRNIQAIYRRFPALGLNRLPGRVTPHREQKPLGSYPVPPEAELVWKNRLTARGGFIAQTISPYQQKIIFPFWHTLPARLDIYKCINSINLTHASDYFCSWWARFSVGWWHWTWPFILTVIILKKMFHDAEKEIKDKFWWVQSNF